MSISNQDAGSTGSVLTIDLTAIAANYRRLAKLAWPAEAAGVVKANAYGLGIEAVAPALAASGCGRFFVAHLDEGIALRRLLADADIFILNGALPGAEAEFTAHRLLPVLNSFDAVGRWTKHGQATPVPCPAALHLDTGMSRLGLPPDELDRLADDPSRLAGIDLRLVMSHLACAEEPDNALNAAQLADFAKARARLPAAPASLANSSGIFLGPDYRFDLVRPGVALYGVNPTPGQANPMRAVVGLSAPILQARRVDSPKTVGYGATHRISNPSRIATVAIGYADGYLRGLSNRGTCYIGEHRVPVVGRISMDLVTLDVSAVPEALAQPDAPVEIIGPNHSVDDLAAEAGTIGYEILTALGHRYHRRYSEADT